VSTQRLIPNGSLTVPLGVPSGASVWIRRVTGTGPVGIYDGSSTGRQYITANLTTDWQRFFVEDVTVNTSAWYGVILDTDFDEVEVYGFQTEYYAANATALPSEYVANPASDPATKHYANLNGNTVLSNVVTEAVGAALAVVPSLYAAPAMTNLVTYSDTSVGWNWQGGTGTNAVDEVGLTGEPNTATTLNDNSNTATISMSEDVVVPAAANACTNRVFIKKDANTSRFAAVQIQVFSGGTNRSAQWGFNTQTGATALITSGGGGNPAIQVDSVGDWWAVYTQIDNDTNTLLRSQIWPAWSTTIDGAADATLQDSVILGNCESYDNKTIARVYGDEYSGADVNRRS
jgi:hypothetical protein